MKRCILFLIASALLLTLILSGCGSNLITETVPTITDTAMPTITITTTPDLCAPENVRAEVDKVHRHMREFDGRHAGASMPAATQHPIANLQKIRRDAEMNRYHPAWQN
jgi:hypothetical protein